MKAISTKISRIVSWRQWPLTVWLVLLLTLIGGFLRFYRLEQTVMFLGDQGRDAIVVSRMFTRFDPVFIGPVTSVGNMYLGPFYYYYMLPFLWLSYPSPMGPVYAVAAFSTLLIPLSFWSARKLVGGRAALLLALLITFSSSLIELSRFSWNPNLAPLMSWIWFYCLYQAAAGKRWYWTAVGFAVAVMLQLHYIMLLCLAVTGLVWLWRAIVDIRSGKAKQLVKPSLVAAAIVISFQVPLILFDWRHRWLNSHQFVKLLQGEDAFASPQTGLERVVEVVLRSRERLVQVVGRLTFHLTQSAAFAAVYTLIGAVALFWFRDQRRSARKAVQLAFLVVAVSMAGFGFYKNDVYLHYLAFLLPIVFFLVSYVLDRLLATSKWQSITLSLVLIFYLLQNLTVISFAAGGPRLDTLRRTAEAIHGRLQPGDPYTMLLISQSKDLYGMNYRYYLTTNRLKEPLDPEHFAEARTMFVVWEDKEVTEPLRLPLYELLVFDIATPSAVFDIEGGPTVLELRKGE